MPVSGICNGFAREHATILPPGARVVTSSLRRRALVARFRPDVELVELRGNVPTRIGKLDDGGYDAILLAAAGVKRLGLEDRISAYLATDSFLPAVSQGAIGVQIRTRAVRVECARIHRSLYAGLRRVPGGACNKPTMAVTMPLR